MANFEIPDKTLLTSVDRATDSLLIYDADALALKRATVNNLLDLTSHPVGINDTQTLTAKTLTSPTISSPVLSGTVTGTYTLAGTPTFPAAVVTLTGIQTITNKTLTAPTITTATISNPTLTVDSINEFTSANGVTIDGLNIKDSKLNTNNSVVTNNITDSAVTMQKIDYSTIPACHIYRTTNFTTAASTWESLTFDSEDFDNTNMHSTSTNTSRVTIATSGKYLITGQVSFQNPNTTIGGRFRKNGADNRTAAAFLVSPASGDYTINLATTLSLVANDYIEIQSFTLVGTKTIFARSTGADAEFHTHLTVTRIA